MYDELFDLPEEMTSADEEVTSHDLWMLAGHLTNAHNTAKANKQAVRYYKEREQTEYNRDIEVG